MKAGPTLALLSAAVALAVPLPAFAYMGPALGLGALTTMLGVLGALALGLFSIIWYPVKRLFRRLRRRPDREDEQ